MKLKLVKRTPEQKEIDQQVDQVEECYNSREEVINFFKHYAKMILDNGYKAKQDKAEQDETKQHETKQDRTGFKILIPKQMRQTLPIALAQVKAGNNSEIY